MIIRSISRLAAFTFVSRLLGLVRSMLLASFMGTTFIADAFTIAFKIPNLLRTLVAEGSLTASFVPIFAEVQKEANHDKRKESVFLSRFFTMACIVLLGICAVGIFFSPFLVKFLFAFGEKSPELAILLTRVLFCYIGFISLAALTQGVLNSNFYFSLPAASPIVLNLTIIACAYSLRDLIPVTWILPWIPETAQILAKDPSLLPILKSAFAFSIGILLGGFLQFFIQAPMLCKLGYRLRPDFHWRDVHLFKVLKLMIPGLFALGIYQINALIADPFALAYLDSGSISALNYSSRLIEFSLGIFTVSISTVMLPNLSKAVVDKDSLRYTMLVQNAVKSVIFISIPSALGLLILREPIVSLLLESGHFSQESVKLVGSALFYHALGLLPIGLYRIYGPAFYAHKDTRTPVVGAFLSLLSNLIFCATLTQHLGVAGIALAATLSATLNALFLMTKLHLRIPEIRLNLILKTTILTLLASGIMGIVLEWGRHLFLMESSSRLILALKLFGLIGTGIGVFFICALLFRIEEIVRVKERLFWKWRTGEG